MVFVLGKSVRLSLEKKGLQKNDLNFSKLSFKENLQQVKKPFLKVIVPLNNMRPDGWIKITSNKTDWVYYSRSEILSLKRPIFLPVAKDFTNAEDKSLDPYHSTTSLQSATLAVEEWNSGVVPEINSLFPIELAANQISSNRMGAISPLVSRRKTEKELEKSLETPLIQPLNQSISNCKEILIEAIIQKNGQDPKFDHLDWEFVHSLLIDYIIRSNSFIQLDQFQGILFKVWSSSISSHNTILDS